MKKKIFNILNQNKNSQDELNLDVNSLEHQKKLLAALRYDQNTKDRKWLTKWAAIVVSAWLFLVLVILALNHCLLKLSDSVLITLLTTTTFNILGLTFIVLKGLFYTIYKNKK